MDFFDGLFLIGCTLPGIIRGAFWYDSPSGLIIIWIPATFAVVIGAGWVTGMIFGTGIMPAVIMFLLIVVINSFMIKEAFFSSSNKKFVGDIDGDENE